MADSEGDPKEESIGALFGRLAEDGRAYARAELDLFRQIARRRAARARGGLIALILGALLLLSSLTALIFGLVLWLAGLIGALLAGLAVAALLVLVGYALIRFGINGLKALGGDEKERAALTRGETLP
ncbi:MAG TPA: phage holin family protein [Allosphingosinicella sp.]|nr:phage holin family protein [Allosphingosinicella sp.]